MTSFTSKNKIACATLVVKVAQGCVRPSTERAVPRIGWSLSTCFCRRRCPFRTLPPEAPFLQIFLQIIVEKIWRRRFGRFSALLNSFSQLFICGGWVSTNGAAASRHVISDGPERLSTTQDRAQK